MTSTSLIETARLKKCMPTPCFGFFVDEAISVMLILEVFEASMACFGAAASSAWEICP